MFDHLRRANPGVPVYKIFWWKGLRLLCLIWFVIFYRFKRHHPERVPAVGSVLIVSNHQSFFDPIIIGLGTRPRHFLSLARKTLFDNPLFGWWIRMLNAIPVDQEASDLKAMRACVQGLKDGSALLLYPEGARTLTGKTEAFAPGVMLLVKRAKPLVIPAAIEGAFHAYPRGSKRPRLFGRIQVDFGEPIPAETLLAMPGEQAIEHLQRVVEDMRQQLAGETKSPPG